VIHSAEAQRRCESNRTRIEVNGRKYPVHSDADIPLLFVLREEIGLTGTKYWLREGQCGACTVLIGGSPRRSCQVPVGEATQPIRTIEDLEKRRQVASHTADISGPRGVFSVPNANRE
jgi:aerobic-type carbon monoxide dehydrogenase small subunit (CoxS/CutS family)